MEKSTKTVEEQHATTSGPMLMVITLKSGVQIKVDVSEYSTRRNGLNELVGLSWEATEDTAMVPEYVNMAEVAAVHTEWPERVEVTEDSR